VSDSQAPSPFREIAEQIARRFIPQFVIQAKDAEIAERMKTLMKEK
jgi:hypothetical protein